MCAIPLHRSGGRRGAHGRHLRGSETLFLGGESDELVTRVYRATILLANGEPSEAHREMMQRKARVLARALMKVFWPEASGSLHHACYLLDFLLRNHADEVRRARSAAFGIRGWR